MDIKKDAKEVGSNTKCPSTFMMVIDLVAPLKGDHDNVESMDIYSHDEDFG